MTMYCFYSTNPFISFSTAIKIVVYIIKNARSLVGGLAD